MPYFLKNKQKRDKKKAPLGKGADFQSFKKTIHSILV